jgi:riboflavin synthase
MFTGLIEDTGEIVKIQPSKRGLSLRIKTRLPMEEISPGDSIAIDGVCLTVTEITRELLFDVSPETVKTSILGMKKTGDRVNLERALQLSERLGGHIVTGHIDGTAVIGSINKNGDFTEIYFTADNNILKYIIDKGSVTINGISLTVNTCSNHGFSVMIIPHTLSGTTLRSGRTGDVVNIENDIIGKYVEKLLSKNSTPENGVTAKLLEQFNFK